MRDQLRRKSVDVDLVERTSRICQRLLGRVCCREERVEPDRRHERHFVAVGTAERPIGDQHVDVVGGEHAARRRDIFDGEDEVLD
ncbi:MAG: hypothetical protein ACK55Z_28990, partial [bacterium]